MIPRQDDYDNVPSNDGSPQEEEEVEMQQLQHHETGCEEDQPKNEEMEPFVAAVGVEQPLPIDDVEQPQDSGAPAAAAAVHPTDIEEDDDEVTIRWKTSPYAVGKVKLRWSDEFVLETDSANDEAPTTRRNPQKCSPHAVISCMASLCCDSWTERVGNMSVIYKRASKDGDHPPEIVIVAGPFWFVTFLITIPLIVGISLVIYFKYIRCYNKLGLELGWGILLGILLVCLLSASLSNPGILLRHSEPPPSNNNNSNDDDETSADNNNDTNDEEWIWNDQALTYRPKNAKYDPICAVVVEGFDHVCPWVGTAIGARNMRWFRRFILMIGICLFYDLALLYLADCYP